MRVEPARLDGHAVTRSTALLLERSDVTGCLDIKERLVMHCTYLSQGAPPTVSGARQRTPRAEARRLIDEFPALEVKRVVPRRNQLLRRATYTDCVPLLVYRLSVRA